MFAADRLPHRVWRRISSGDSWYAGIYRTEEASIMKQPGSAFHPTTVKFG